MYLCYSNLRSLPYLMYHLIVPLRNKFLNSAWTAVVTKASTTSTINKEDPVDCSYLVNKKH